MCYSKNFLPLKVNICVRDECITFDRKLGNKSHFRMHQIINEPIHILENPYLCIDLLLNLTGKFFDIFGILLPFTKGRPLQRGVSLRFFNSPKKKGFQIFLLKKEEFVK